MYYSLKEHPKNYTHFMTVNKGLKNYITDDMQNTNLYDSSFKMLYIVSKDPNVILIVMRPPKTQS